MRKLIVTEIISLDGCFEGPGSDVMALPMDQFFDTHNLERLRAADTMLLGRTTYEGFRSFWPSMADNPDASAASREISRINNVIEKVVVSDSLSADDTDPWRDTTSIVRRTDAHAKIAELKAQDGRDILTFGSGTLLNDLLQAGLVDELHLMVGPTVLPGGTPAFAQAPPGRMRLLGTRTLVGSDNVIMQYAVDPS
jgi:dihydrofolate reductase